MASTVAIAAAMLTPIPLIIGAVAEAAYLIFVPDSKWYASRLQSKFDAEVVARREKLKAEVFPFIRPQLQQEFNRLEQVRAQITGQSRTEEKWFQEAMRKLDFLMEKYLEFALKEAQFGNYVASVYAEVCSGDDQDEAKGGKRLGGDSSEPPPIRRRRVESDAPPRMNFDEKWVASVVKSIRDAYDSEVANLSAAANDETIMANRSLMEKRLQIIARRKDFIVRVEQILTNLRLQMHLMSDTFGLINDEIRARSPEQVLSDIDDVMVQATSLTQAIDEMTPMTELVGSY